MWSRKDNRAERKPPDGRLDTALLCYTICGRLLRAGAPISEIVKAHAVLWVAFEMLAQDHFPYDIPVSDISYMYYVTIKTYMTLYIKMVFWVTLFADIFYVIWFFEWLPIMVKFWFDTAIWSWCLAKSVWKAAERCKYFDSSYYYVVKNLISNKLAYCCCS